MRWQFNFMGTARIWVAISLIVTLAGLVSLAVRGLNLGIDYTGGTEMLVLFEKADTTVAEVRDVVAREVGKSPTVKATTVEGKPGAAFYIQTEQLGVEARQQLVAALEQALGKVEVLSASEIGGSIRTELILQALMALGIASVLQVIYITIRFEYRFAVTAILALLHDVLITLGLVSILGVEVGPPFLAAVLTVIGYSVNDTIVIFDRIRENLRRPHKGESLPALVNRSINETLARSMYTGVTTLMALVAIYLWGEESTRDFALALLIGVVSGTYSSIFVASPLWLWWREWDQRRKHGRPALANR